MNTKYIFTSILAIMSFVCVQSQEISQKILINNFPEEGKITVELITYGEKETSVTYEGEKAREFLKSRNMDPNPIVIDGVIVSETNKDVDLFNGHDVSEEEKERILEEERLKSLNKVYVASIYVDGLPNKDKVAETAKLFMDGMFDDLVKLASKGATYTEYQFYKLKIKVKITGVESFGEENVVFVKEIRVSKI